MTTTTMPDFLHLDFYQCSLIDILVTGDGYALKVRLHDSHRNGAPAGDIVVTSALRSINFDHGVAVTQNSVYHWAVRR